MSKRTKTKPVVNKPQSRKTVAEWAVTLLILLFGSTTLVEAFVIPTSSMEDSVLVGDHLLVDRLAYAPAGAISRYLLPYEEPKHGDIIVFPSLTDRSETLIKRLIGMPGDRIKMVNRVVYRNGIRLNEPYVYHKLPYDAVRDNFPGGLTPWVDPQHPLQAVLQEDMLAHHVVNGEVVVPPNSYFAMGDNRDVSLDSRYWGFVPRDYIVGKPILVYWSYRASTEDLLASSPGSMLAHFVDVGEHFFTRTRWDRTFLPIRGFPDSKLPDHPLPINTGSSNP